MPEATNYPEDVGAPGEKVLVAEIGVEGGGITIFGVESNGVWLFWAEGSSMDLDENDDEVWRTWSLSAHPDLELILPREWPLHYPVAVHPMFVGWFRLAYETARSALSPYERQIQEDNRHHHWMGCLGS